MMVGTDFYRIHYSPQYEGDIAKIAFYLNNAIESMLDEFDSFGLRPILENVDLNVYIEPEPSDRTSEGHTGITSGTRGNSFFADLYQLSPSAHRRGCCTNVQEPYDDVYFQKTLTHEYSTIALSNITRLKGSGWSFHSAPSWFVQGYEEYLGLTRSSEHSRTITLQKYKDVLRNSPDSIYVGGFGIDTSSPYINGTLLILFLHETFGKERVHNLLASPELNFFVAFEKETGVTLNEMQALWEEWVEEVILSPTPGPTRTPLPAPTATPTPIPEVAQTPSTPAPSTDEPGLVMVEFGPMRIHYAPQYEADVSLIAPYVEHAKQAMKEEFAALDIEEFLDNMPLDVYLFPEPSNGVEMGASNGGYGTLDGSLNTYYGLIRLLSPSVHTETCRTYFNEPCDENYFLKTITFEYSNIVLALVNRGGLGSFGWQYYQAPYWFRNGYQEYLAVTRSSEYSRSYTLGKYIDRLKNRPSTVNISGSGISARHSYLDSAMIMMFLHEMFDSETVQAILTTNGSDFTTTFEKALGVTLDELAELWLEWVESLQ